MATRTWKYASSPTAAMTYTIPDYGNITIPITASGVKPTGFVYVDALRGDDVNGNGSMLYPYASIGKNLTDTAIVSSGTYREAWASTARNVISDGISCLDGYGGMSIDTNLLFNFDVKNYIFVNVGWCIRCMCHNNDRVKCSNANVAKSRKSIYYNNKLVTVGTPNGWVPGYNDVGNNVYYSNLNVLVLDQSIDYACQNNVFLQNNISFGTASKVSYCNFNSNNVRFSTNQSPNQTVLPNVSHKTTPLTGYTYIDGSADHDIAVMKALHLSTWGTSWSATGCTDDPMKLVDVSTAVPNLLQDISYIVKIGYAGMPIGIGAGMGFKVRADAAACDFDHANSVNCAFADGVITFPSATQASTILTKTKDGGKIRLYRSPMFLGFQADRNGRIFDYSSDLAASTISPGTGVLETDTCYVVEVDAITYNGTLYAIGAKFTTRTVIDFSATGAGVVRKVVSFPNSQTFRIRYSKTQSDVSSQPWLTMKYGEDCYFSTDDGTIVGANPKGNGDPNYDPTKKQPLYVRWWQEEHTAQINMLH